MRAARDNANKPRFISQLAHFRHALESWVAHVEAGRDKYPDVSHPETGEIVPNWTLGGKPNSEYLDAIARHAFKIALGEVYDEETGTKHTAAIQWNAAALDVLNQADYPATLPEPLTDEDIRERLRLERTELAQQEFGATTAPDIYGQDV